MKYEKRKDFKEVFFLLFRENSISSKVRAYNYGPYFNVDFPRDVKYKKSEIYLS